MATHSKSTDSNGKISVKGGNSVRLKGDAASKGTETSRTVPKRKGTQASQANKAMTKAWSLISQRTNKD